MSITPAGEIGLRCRLTNKMPAINTMVAGGIRAAIAAVLLLVASRNPLLLGQDSGAFLMARSLF